VPRRKTIQPEPDEVIETAETIIEVRGNNSQIIKRGWDKKYQSQETDHQVMLGLINDLQSNDIKRINKARDVLQNNSTLAIFMALAGYEGTDRTLRKRSARIREDLEKLLGAQEKYLSEDDERKIKYILHPPK